MPPCAVPAQKTPGRAGSAASDFTSAPGSGYRYHAPGVPRGGSPASGNDTRSAHRRPASRKRMHKFSGKAVRGPRLTSGGRFDYFLGVFFLDGEEGAVEVFAAAPSEAAPGPESLFSFEESLESFFSFEESPAESPFVPAPASLVAPPSPSFPLSLIHISEPTRRTPIS